MDNSNTFGLLDFSLFFVQEIHINVLVSQLDFNYYLINFHLDIMLGILYYHALDINFVILRFIGYSCIWLQCVFFYIHFIHLICVMSIYSCRFLFHSCSVIPLQWHFPSQQFIFFVSKTSFCMEIYMLTTEMEFLFL